MYCSTPVIDGQDTGMAITRQRKWSKYGRFFLPKPRYVFYYIPIYPNRWAILDINDHGCWSTDRLQTPADFPSRPPFSLALQPGLFHPGCRSAGQSIQQPASAVGNFSDSSLKHILVRPGGDPVSRHLADILQSCQGDFITGGRGTRTSKDFYVAAHKTSSSMNFKTCSVNGT